MKNLFAVIASLVAAVSAFGQAAVTRGGVSGLVVQQPNLVFTTPVLGAATATSINGLTLSTSTGTLTITNAKVFSVTNTLTLSGTDGTVMTFPSTSASIARIDAGQTFVGTQAFAVATASTSFTSPVFSSNNADPADTGVIRLGNADVIAWESSPAGTDVTLGINTSEQFVFSNAILSPTLVTPALGTPASGVMTNVTGLPTAGMVDGAVTLAKMADLAQDQFIGRTTASTGVPQTATITAAARTVLDDTTVGAMVDTLGGATSVGTGGLARGTSPAFTTSVTTGSTTLAVFNTTATTVNAFGGASTALNMGNASGATSMLGIIAFNGATASSTTSAIFPASTTGVSSLRIPHGSAPTSPVNGDFWSTSSGFFGRVNGSTVGPFTTGGGSGTVSSGTTNTLSKYTASTTVGNSAATDDGTTFTYSGTGGMTSAGPITAGGSNAGALVLTQGSTQSAGTTNITIQAPAAVTSYIRTLPAAVGSTGFLLETVSGSVQTESLVAGTGTGSVVQGTSPAFTTSVTTGSSSFDVFNTTATTVNAFGATTTLNLGAAATMILNFGGSTTASELRFLEPSGSGTNYTAFKAVAQGANITYSLPATVGAAGSVMTDAAGNGVLSWAAGGAGDMILASVQTVTGAKTFGTIGGAVGKFILAGSSSGSTILNAAAAAGSGTITLPTGTDTLAGLGTAQTFTANNIFTTTVTTGSGATAGLNVTANSLTTGNGVEMTSSSVTTGNVVRIAATGTAAGSNTKTALNVATSGANGTSAQTTYGVQIANTSTGTTSNNIGAQITASGGATNTALVLVGGMNLGTTGVRITDDGDGAITFASISGGSTEDMTINLDDTANTWVFSSSTGVTTASFGGIGLTTTGSSSLGPLVDSVDGTTPLMNVVATYGAGTSYSLTATSAAIDLGTTDPVAVIPNAGTYLISGIVNLKYNASTFAANRDVTVKLRRTNNTAADLTNGSTVVTTGVVTTLTNTFVQVRIGPVLYTTANTNDSITIFADVAVVPSAGSLDAQASGTSIVAERKY